ncbi:hypothetical protein C1H46_009936 [Malus baccata]|uniref:Uncharacterized protein n=1 Tax=Malus baccata TaxID=106549 RepID=A0A540N056_MALBA|nr:hypothetical protein C1H46_009936 [Malus baccata]
MAVFCKFLQLVVAFCKFLPTTNQVRVSSSSPVFNRRWRLLLFFGLLRHLALGGCGIWHLSTRRLLTTRKAALTGVLFTAEELLATKECDRCKGVLAVSEAARCKGGFSPQMRLLVARECACRKGVAGLHVLPLLKGSCRTARTAVVCEDEDTPLLTAIIVLLHVSCCCIVADAAVRTSFHAAAMPQRR